MGSQLSIALNFMQLLWSPVQKPGQMSRSRSAHVLVSGSGSVSDEGKQGGGFKEFVRFSPNLGGK